MGMLIGKNDLCPCGSGKKYKKCCDGDLEYLGTENYEGKQIVYNKTQIESGRKKAKELLEQLLDKETKKPLNISCLLYTSPSPRDRTRSRMPSSA